MINTIINKYKITRLIGQGGMSSVYEAEHELLGTKVAIKVLNPILSSNAQIRERFINEAKVMASLDHPNITRVIDFDEQPGQLSIVMEFLAGQDLKAYIEKKGAMLEQDIAQYLVQTLSALQYAHTKGIVHRDIKPSNIYILPDGRVKILDFGIAKLFGEGNEMTQTGTQIGTPIYMSPEQVKADKTIDHRSDIYSLGVTMFYAMNGQPPYDSNTTSQFDIFSKIVYEPLPALAATGRLNEQIQKACSKDRNQRFESCQEWLEAIQSKESSAIPSPAPSTSVLSHDKTVIVSPESDQTILETPSSSNADKTEIGNEEPVFIPNSNNSNFSPKIPSKKRRWLIPVIISALVLISGAIGIFYAIENKDSDHDGVIDKYDFCTYEQGDMDGCPDSDSDGFPDYSDDCPDVPSEDHRGCPDSDNDGVIDANDDCPDYPGKGETGCTLPGSYAFWFDIDENGKWEGPVQIFIDDEYQGEVTSWYTVYPGCDAEGCVTVYLEPGFHTFFAKTATNLKWRVQELEFVEDECKQFRMWVN